MGHPKTRPGVRTAGIRQFPTSGTLLAQGKGQLIAWVQILGSTVRQCLYFKFGWVYRNCCLGRRMKKKFKLDINNA